MQMVKKIKLVRSGTNNKTSVIDLGVIVEKDKWSHLVVNFNNNGIFEVFKNGIFENTINTKIQNDVVEFKNIKIRILWLCG